MFGLDPPKGLCLVSWLVLLLSYIFMTEVNGKTTQSKQHKVNGRKDKTAASNIISTRPQTTQFSFHCQTPQQSVYLAWWRQPSFSRMERLRLKSTFIHAAAVINHPNPTPYLSLLHSHPAIIKLSQTQNWKGLPQILKWAPRRSFFQPLLCCGAYLGAALFWVRHSFFQPLFRYGAHLEYFLIL